MNVIHMPPPVTSDNPFAKYDTPDSPILFPVGERGVGWQMENGDYLHTPTHKAIVRLRRDGHIASLLNIVGSNYRLVHNRELFNKVQDVMINEMLPSHLHDVQVTDRVSSYGRVCYREYRFPSIRCRLRQVKSDIGFRIIVQNGYGGSGLRILAGAIDYYCTNGLVSGDYTSTYRKHTSGLVVGNLTGVITKALMQFTLSQDTWNKWSQTPVQHDATMKLFDAISQSKKMREGLIDQYTRERDDRGHNLWALYSALTFYSSHNDGAFTLRRTVDEQDTVAQTMLARELNVAKWIQSPEWQALEGV